MGQPPTSTMLELKQFNTAVPIRQTLTLGGAAINLTGATVDLLWRKAPDGLAKRLPAAIVTAAAGLVEYQPASEDMLEAGDFDLEWEINYPTGDRLSVPTTGYVRLRIHPALITE